MAQPRAMSVMNTLWPSPIICEWKSVLTPSGLTHRYDARVDDIARVRTGTFNISNLQQMIFVPVWVSYLYLEDTVESKMEQKWNGWPGKGIYRYLQPYECRRQFE